MLQKREKRAIQDIQQQGKRIIGTNEELSKTRKKKCNPINNWQLGRPAACLLKIYQINALKRGSFFLQDYELCLVTLEFCKVWQIFTARVDS
jgi:hypothetical protein